MEFRGPDNSEFKLINEKVVLGHNRLAIIDLNERSNQPFRYHHLTITFNGQIYNFKKIKDGQIFDICYSIDENDWNGRKNLQLKLRDIKSN